MKTSIWGSVIFALILVLSYHSTKALRILGIFPYTSRSHFIPNGHLMRGLANRGHQVDVVSFHPLKKPVPNYTDISLAGISPDSTNNLTYEESLELTQLSKKSYFHNIAIKACDLLSNHVFQQLLKTPKNTYDVIIVELFTAQCYIAFGKHLNAPVVGTVLSKIQDWHYGPFGVPLNTAYMPSLFSASSQSMTFVERLQNTLLMNFVNLQSKYYMENQREYVEIYFGRRLSTMNEIFDDVALVLVNSHHSLNGIMPFPTGIIEVGGLQVQDDQQELSQDIKEWLDGSKNSCVYISFGSMLRIETYPSDTLKAFYEMFESIAPVRVLMKVADATKLPPNLPNNVKTSPWLPQIAVLKHRNIKVFITHGGQLGTQEAVLYGVPMIGIPMFTDQNTNIDMYESKNVAIALKHEDITGESLTNAIKTVLNDPTYSKNIRKLSKLFSDRPMSPLNTAVYWVEYAARHGNVLQSPATRLTWWQYYLLDVYGSILIVVCILLYVVKRIYSSQFGQTTIVTESKKNM